MLDVRKVRDYNAPEYTNTPGVEIAIGNLIEGFE